MKKSISVIISVFIVLILLLSWRSQSTVKIDWEEIFNRRFDDELGCVVDIAGIKGAPAMSTNPNCKIFTLKENGNVPIFNSPYAISFGICALAAGYEHMGYQMLSAVILSDLDEVFIRNTIGFSCEKKHFNKQNIIKTIGYDTFPAYTTPEGNGLSISHEKVLHMLDKSEYQEIGMPQLLSLVSKLEVNPEGWGR